MGFQEEIEKIVSELPPRIAGRPLLFSATIPAEIERIGKRHMREYDRSSCRPTSSVCTRSIIAITWFPACREPATFCASCNTSGPARDHFCNTRDDTALVAGFLQRQGYIAEPISSDLTQADRERVMGLMRAGKVKFLCATDIAARGIDISGLSHVFNYTFPESPEVYIHRTEGGPGARATLSPSLIGRPREIGSFIT